MIIPNFSVALKEFKMQAVEMERCNKLDLVWGGQLHDVFLLAVLHTSLREMGRGPGSVFHFD